MKIVNPKRNDYHGARQHLTENQKNDFEVIRRKYRNVVDIVPTMIILRRLKVIRDHVISQIEINSHNGTIT